MGGFTQIPNATGKFDCETWDITCKIKNIFTGIADTFTAVGNAIVDGITALFSVDTTTMGYEFDQLKEFLIDKLGFLAYPFEWIIDTLDGLYGGIVADGSWGTGFCAIDEFDWGFDSGTFFGSNININWCSSLVNNITTYTQILFPVFISYALIRSFKHHIDEVHQK